MSLAPRNESHPGATIENPFAVDMVVFGHFRARTRTILFQMRSNSLGLDRLMVAFDRF